MTRLRKDMLLPTKHLRIKFLNIIHSSPSNKKSISKKKLKFES
ncbi:hypothetical protein LEP1GSC062_2557 [Leptospira alexanderi serovar Manhao 3 str. L 60]|uniref:Uncharacterized protein n=1 Tax=Leptospira alexanderi serovar Manhao 3 str. L 60 TaxID=1049759 RepID=V6I018_9LEPT|nr:hypothetical protein LEP1GSC062_2557 [Leptospira alexanderi serovar Manhao 3 str. L 60]